MDKTKKIKEIVPILADDLDFFENELRKIINQSNDFLKDDLNLFMFSNSKRLRPIFTLLFAQILNISDFKTVINICLAVEILHNASLIHDDILDNEKLRRNNPTFFEKYGAKIAVLEGDLLLSMALNVLSDTNLEILKIFSDKIQKTLDGEIQQNATINKLTDENQYIKKTFNKTGNLFLAGLESLFTLKKIDDSIKSNLINFMQNYAIAFQIKNDTDNIKDKNSTDIKNGNYTLPVLYFCNEYGYNIPDCKNQCFQKCIKKANKKVAEYKNLALSYLENTENTIYKETLINLCNQTLRSKF